MFDLLNNNGFVGPFTLADISLLEEVITELDGLDNSFLNAHVSSHLFRKLICDIGIVNNVKQYFGKDLKIWRTNSFKKVSGSGEVKWHHDRHFENGNSPIEFSNLKNHFSILLAITDIDEKSGVIEFIPGSHLPSQSYKQDIRPYHRRKSDEHFLSIPEYLAEKRISVPLKRGEFMLFHSGLLHRSLAANGKDVNRYSMVARLCTSNTIIPLELAPESAICEFPFQ